MFFQFWSFFFPFENFRPLVRFVSGHPSVPFRAQWLRVRFRTSVFVRLRATGVSGTVSVRRFSSWCSFALLLPDFPPSCSSSSPPWCCRDFHGRLDSRRSQSFGNPAHDPQKAKHALLLFSRRRMCVCFIPGPQIEYNRRASCSQKLKPLIPGGQDLRRCPGVARKGKKQRRLLVISFSAVERGGLRIETVDTRKPLQ